MAGAGFPDEPGGPIDSEVLGPDRVELERRRALEDPGQPWKEWFYFTAFKWWLATGFLIIDSWVVTTFIEIRSWLPLAAATIGTLYLELLLYSYLWHRPHPDRARTERRLLWPAFEIGRWTPEGFRRRAGSSLGPGEEGAPDPREFL